MAALEPTLAFSVISKSKVSVLASTVPVLEAAGQNSSIGAIVSTTSAGFRNSTSETAATSRTFSASPNMKARREKRDVSNTPCRVGLALVVDGDVMTGANNDRRFFNERLGEEPALHRVPSHPLNAAY